MNKGRRPRAVAFGRLVGVGMVVVFQAMHPRVAPAQEVAIRAARYLNDSTDLDGVTLSVALAPRRVLRLGLTASYWSPVGNAPGALYGAGLEVQALRSLLGRGYFVAGVDAGAGTREMSGLWGSYSAGIGAELLGGGPVGLVVEARYRALSDGSRTGVEIGGRLGLDVGVHRGRVRSGGREAAPASPRPVDPATLVLRAGGAGSRRAGIIQTALDARGTPYRWGGTTENGFDCSGLIQYAFGAYQVALPRRSVDQAKVGAPVERRLEALQPGDILTFDTDGQGTVTHVGLYVGEGQFLHSSSTGVTLSRLSDVDPYGAWWYHRWVGARRIDLGKSI